MTAAGYSPAPLVFIDAETDGVHPARRPWEVAIIRREPTGERAEYRAFLPINLDTADPIGLVKGGFYQRHPLGRWIAGTDQAPRPPQPYDVPDYRHPGDVAHELARASFGAHWVGAVPNFDTEVAAPLLRNHGLTPGWHYHLIDVENLAVGFLLGRAAGLRDASALVATRPGDGDTDAVLAGWASGAVTLAREVGSPPWRSDDLSAACGIDPPGDTDRHTALGDARWCERWYDRLRVLAGLEPAPGAPAEQAVA